MEEKQRHETQRKEKHGIVSFFLAKHRLSFLKKRINADDVGQAALQMIREV